MPTQITQSAADNGRGTVLRVEGELLFDDAVVIERVASQLLEEGQGPVTIDLADLDFLDSEAAAVLRRLEIANGLRIAGIEIFLQSAIDAAERTA
ncbi:MAG TPA: STAS domain-containing protein [Pyrinomonadaceae bacterium]|nr:STAS domain-containing protein [Pyrinomonadaceae bacterium]HMP66256.1 STAS domain-containing protein [Pyrinomonadaceae bacterium]